MNKGFWAYKKEYILFHSEDETACCWSIDKQVWKKMYKVRPFNPLPGSRRVRDEYPFETLLLPLEALSNEGIQDVEQY